MSSDRIVTLGSVSEKAWERRALYHAGHPATLSFIEVTESCADTPGALFTLLSPYSLTS